MPKIDSIKKTLVLGSGPIIIGQAAEFDYSGTQACGALKEEGIEVVLINSNPATIMTDKEVADKILICDTGSADNTKEILNQVLLVSKQLDQYVGTKEENTSEA